jgi:hypothetical protein
MGNSVENNLPRGRLTSLNRVLPGFAVQEDIQFRYFDNPTPIDFAVELDRELHSHSLLPMTRRDDSEAPSGKPLAGVLDLRTHLDKRPR